MRLIIALTVFCLLAKPAFPVLEYVLQYDYISKVLCENKAKPELHCNGKCHLMKELAKASEADKSDSHKPNDKKGGTFEPDWVFLLTPCATALSYTISGTSPIAVHATPRLLQPAFGDILKPPCF
ncbi:MULTISPECIES: hypothetical protein [unclassified Flavobacterium]|uniref:hypothetical protein n=1 Tax=unclassified Flavobacterium TaxID=196869 RepID=UPI001F12EAB2|nr:MULTISPECIES: hypothetical protein [unclassified Flavobacterium]UMY65200.1 hypothetical protein MKO97_11905 [Flavobacterium sp. HJ-32-4]